MKDTIITQNNRFKAITLLAFVLVLGGLVACEDFVLPEEGSIPDATPPAADFSTAPSDGDYQEINFTNLSISATDYAWGFGDGATSNEANPAHTYDEAEEGIYTVSLTASDKLGQTSTITKTVEVTVPLVLFTPTISNPGFDIQGEDEYRDGWRNSSLGGPIQITGSPVHIGEKGAKLPTTNDRIGYQLIAVEPEKDYTLSFYYTMKTSPVGTLTMSILGGAVNDPAAVEGATIASVTLNDQSSASTYVSASLSFNSGIHSSVAIYFSNVDVECRLDTFSIIED